jgi:hypothetical protein
MADAESPDDACESCNLGYYQNIAARSECEACLPGKWNDQNGMKDESNCKNCTKGTYSSSMAAVSECNKCAAGKMNDNVGSSNSDDCEDCRAGQYRTSRMSATTCQECSKGTYNNNIGSVSCIPCSPGKFSSKNASAKCNECPAGYLQPEPEQSKCDPVKAGSIVAKGGSVSVVVPLGSKIKASAPSGFEACEAGTIGNEPPNEACEKCTAGKSSTKGATECHPCDKGKFSGKDGTTCQECTAGAFQDQNSLPSLSCKTCPTGYNNDVPGESSCQDLGYTKPEDCNDVYYFNDTAIDPNDWDCAECPLGASCVGNINWGGVQAKFGWSRCHNNNAAFERCTYSGACLGAPNFQLATNTYLDINQTDLALRNDNEICNIGYVNPPQNNSLCSTCSKGYAPVSNQVGKCQACNGTDGSTALLVLMGLFAISIFVILTVMKMRSSGRRKSAHSTLKRTILTRKLCCIRIVCIVWLFYCHCS